MTDLRSSYAALSSEAVRRAKAKRPHSGVHLTTRRCLAFDGLRHISASGVSAASGCRWLLSVTSLARDGRRWARNWPPCSPKRVGAIGGLGSHWPRATSRHPES